MDFARIRNCPIYKENEIVQVNRNIYDKKFNRTNILFHDSTLKDLVADCYVKTIHRHYIKLGNAMPLVTIEDLRYVKLKKILNQ